jgi:general secretion pathway protein I
VSAARSAGRSRPPAAEAGFSLLEVLVALLILATAVVAALQLFGGGLRLVRAAGDHTEAALLASAMLAELAPGRLEEGAEEGQAGAYRWTRRIALEPDLLPVDATRPEAVGLRLARVSVEVRWGSNRRVELVTLRAWRPGS